MKLICGILSKEAKQKATCKVIKKKVLSVTGFNENEITVDHLEGKEYKVTMQAKGSSKKIVKKIIF